MSRREEFFNNVLEKMREDGISAELDYYLYHVDFAEFKLINYYYGYEAGNSLIAAAVDYFRTLDNCVCCSRGNKDHIFFVLKYSSSFNRQVEAFNDIAARFLNIYRKKYSASNLRFWCGIGRIEDENIMEAADNAGMARAEAKRIGIDKAVLIDKEEIGHIHDRYKREAEVMKAVNEDKVSFCLQPKVDMVTEEIVGMEALARLDEPLSSVIDQKTFISTLERNAGIIKLDYMILKRVCRLMKERRDAGKKIVPVSVNLSRLHIADRDTAKSLDAVVKRYGIEPELITFEFTETVFIDSFENAVLLNRELQGLGYRTSIDDFGSGYCGINIFKTLPVNEIKLDRTFLSRDLELKEWNQDVIPAIGKLTQRWKVDVVCEGVENREQVDMLLGLGFTVAQGYYYAKPGAPEDIYEKWIDQI